MGIALMQLELTFGNDEKHLPSVCAFLHTTLQQLPLDASVADQLEEFVVRAARETIEHAYPAGEDGLVKLSIDEQHGKLEIRVRDFGIPQDVANWSGSCTSRGGGHELLRLPAADVVDEVHWLAFGREGKALQVVKWLHERHVTDGASRNR